MVGWRPGSPRPLFLSSPAPPGPPCPCPTPHSPHHSRPGWAGGGGSPRGPLSSCTWWPTPSTTSGTTCASPTRSPSVVNARHKCREAVLAFQPASQTSHRFGRRATTEDPVGGGRAASSHNRAGLGRRRRRRRRRGGEGATPAVSPFPPLSPYSSHPQLLLQTPPPPSQHHLQHLLKQTEHVPVNDICCLPALTSTLPDWSLMQLSASFVLRNPVVLFSLLLLL